MAIGKTIREFGVKVSLLFDQKKAEEAKKEVEEIGKGMRELALHVAEASAVLFELANISGEHSRALEENSAQLGINVERLQELEYAAKIAGDVTRDELVGSLEGLSKTLYEARNNNAQAARSLIQLGVPLELIENRSITADQVLLNLSERFKTLPDGMYKTALASEVFGASGKKLIPLLNKGAEGIAAMGKEARSLGVVMGEGAVKEGAEFSKELSKVWFVIKNITFIIGSELIKYLRGAVELFKSFIVQNRKFIASGIATAMKGLGLYLQIVYKTTKFILDRFKFLITVVGGLERVTRFLGLALGVLAAAKIVSAVGGLVKNFRFLATALGVLQSPALLIGAALTALILIVQDLFSDDSIIKEWINTFAVKFPNATKFVAGSVKFLKAVFEQLGTVFENMVNWIDDVVGSLGEMVSLFGKLSGISGVLGKIGNFFSSGKIGSFFGEKLGSAGDFLSQTASAISNPKAVQQLSPQATSSLAAAPSVAGGKGAATTNNLSANVTVTVPPNTSVSDATNIVSGGVEKGFQNMLRSTRNVALGGVAY